MNHLVREAYAAARELVEDPASDKSERTLAGIRERFDGAAAIFGHALFELEEGNRRAQSTGVALRNEYTAQLAEAREEFARQISEASTHLAEASTQLADVRGEFARQLAEARGEFARQLAETRGEFAR